jgi:hypothetical protein
MHPRSPGSVEHTVESEAPPCEDRSCNLQRGGCIHRCALPEPHLTHNQGHADLSTVSRYAHVAHDELHDAVATIAADAGL